MNRVYAENVIEKIVSAERSAAEIMMHAHDIIAESKSGQRDIVTEYDKRVQEYLMQVLSESVPEARFFCEEQKEHDDLHARHLFIIDPIDGTMNFARGFNHSCISVAYMSAGELRAAARARELIDARPLHLEIQAPRAHDHLVDLVGVAQGRSDRVGGESGWGGRR